MKIREFVEDGMIKLLNVKASETTHKKAVEYRKQIDSIRLIGLKVNGDLNLMDVEIKTKELRFNHFTGDQFIVFNDSIVYNINDNRIYRVKGGFGTHEEFGRKFSRKVKIRTY